MIDAWVATVAATVVINWHHCGANSQIGALKLQCAIAPHSL